MDFALWPWPRGEKQEIVRASSDVWLNNMCDIFNGKLVDGRDKPIIATLEYARKYLMKRKYTVDYAGDEYYQVMSLNNQQAGIAEEWVHPCYRVPKSNKRKVSTKGMDLDTDAPTGSQSKKRSTSQAARSASQIEKGKALATSDGAPKKITPKKKVINLASASSLSTLHFLKLLENKLESMMILENKLESLKLLENKLESMKILENELESLKLQENQPGDGLVLVKGTSDSDTVASPRPRAENELSRKQKTNHSKSGLGLPSIVALVMVIDKSWTSLGKHEKAFYTGLKKFVDDCKPLVDSAGNIRCPCKSCRLVLWVSIKHLSDHISKYGFDPSYKTWIHHGEPDLPPPPPVIDNTRQPQMSDMTACLNDLSYIPLNNEQNEPTQGDIGETSNDPTQAKRNEFEELYASANEELYPGCDHVTRLDFMAKFTYFKVKGLAADGFNPFGMMSQTYSMWPVILTTYNTPPWMCMKETSLMLTMLIPGPKSPAKDIDVYLQPLIKELQELWKGVWTKDAATGYYACPTCNVDTPSMAVKNKFASVGHRRFLRTQHPQRNKFKEYYGSKEPTPKPRKFSELEIQLQISKVIPYGAKTILAKRFAAPIIEFMLNSLSSFQIFPPAFFDIMIHVAIHLPNEAILGGPIRYRWMFPFERYMKKLKNYVRNKAKPEGSIAEGYVAEEALTFCSRYLKDDVETRFNRLGRNDDGLPEEEPNKFQVFRSACKLTGRMKATRLTTDVRQAVVWFVLNNSPEVDADILAYREKSPDNVETNFPAWFNHKIREKKSERRL
ncbi:hypothetical protein Tco_0121367 [Tanacetum coccineum]